MRLLLAVGAVLDEMFMARLTDRTERRADYERIQQIALKLCRAELKSVLPEELFNTLNVEEFESLRAAVEPCSPNGSRRRAEHSVAWAATLQKEAQRPPILRSDAYPEALEALAIDFLAMPTAKEPKVDRLRSCRLGGNRRRDISKIAQAANRAAPLRCCVVVQLGYSLIKELQDALGLLRVEFAEFPVNLGRQLNMVGHDVS